jgi:hypothetical protein
MIDFSTLGEGDLPTEDARILAREIRERWPSLRLVRLSDRDPEFTERRPYAVVDTEPMALHRIMKVLPPSLLNSRLLAELIDQRSRQWGGMTPDRYWALEKAKSDLKKREREEAHAANTDLLLTAFASPLHQFQYHDGEMDDRVIIRK